MENPQSTNTNPTPNAENNIKSAFLLTQDGDYQGIVSPVQTKRMVIKKPATPAKLAPLEPQEKPEFTQQLQDSFSIALKATKLGAGALLHKATRRWSISGEKAVNTNRKYSLDYRSEADFSEGLTHDTGFGDGLEAC